MAFETTAGETMVLRSNNVGIGTDSPSEKLEVVGNIISTFTTVGTPTLITSEYSSSNVAELESNMSGGKVVGTSEGGEFVISSYSDSYINSGNVGVGTTSPARKLHVQGANNNDPVVRIVRGNNTAQYLDIRGYQIQGRGNHLLLTADDTKEIWLGQESNDQRMVINSSGNVGIGTTSPSHELVVQGTSSPNIELKNSNYSDGGFVLNRTNYTQQWKWWAQSSQMYFSFATDESTYSAKMTIQAGGNVGIGTTSPLFQLQLSANSAAKPTSSAWTVVSDERVKTNIRPYETGLQELLQIEPKLFDYNGKAGFDATTKNNIGVIAQEIKDVMPETVKKYNAKLNEEDEEDTELYNFDSHALTFALINSVKELNAKIESLEARIQTLENK